jgi:hypothetical protein
MDSIDKRTSLQQLNKNDRVLPLGRRVVAVIVSRLPAVVVVVVEVDDEMLLPEILRNFFAGRISWSLDYKTFYGRNLRIFVMSLECLSLAQALPTNNKLGWRGLPETNTLAYYETPEITAVKSFIVQAPGAFFKFLKLSLMFSGYGCRTRLHWGTTTILVGSRIT